MRRVVFAVTFVLITALAAGVVSPAVHAQTTTPTVTVSSMTAATGGTITVYGNGFTPNYAAYVYFQRPDGTTNAFNIATDANGYFTFTLGFLASHGTGSEYLSAYDYGTGRWAPTVTITVTSGGPPPVTGPQLSISPNPISVGQVTTVTGTGFSPTNWVYFMYQRPDGSFNAFWIYTSSTGTFTQQLGFLASHGCGNEYVQTYDYGTGTYTSVYTITVQGC
jgi:hypothetical protein